MGHLLTKKAFSLFLVLILTFGTMQNFAVEGVEQDYGSHWAKSIIVSSLKEGLVAGYTDGSFKPDQRVSRAEFMTMINRGFDFNTILNTDFMDVQKNDWFYTEIGKAKAAGYISGYTDGGIHPFAAITRQEAAVMIQRVEGMTAQTQTLIFKDQGDIASWGKTSVKALVETKLMSGYPDGYFKPNVPLTRAEALVLIHNCIEARKLAAVVYNKPGVYGLQASPTIIKGNVRIEAAGVMLENAVIEGDLTIGREVGDGEVTLKKVTIKGNLYVKGGGINSVYFIDVTSGKIYVQRTEGPVRIVASGSSDIGELLVRSDLKLEEVNLSGSGFDGITVEKVGNTGIEINLKGVTCESVDVQSEGVVLQTDAASTISVLKIDAVGTQIKGTGQIDSAVINSTGVTFEKAPEAMTIAKGIETPVVVPSVHVVPARTEERGNPVKEITVTAPGQTSRVVKGYTLQMSAAVMPSNADNSTIVWSVVPETGTATISSSGLVTGTAFGTVTVKATNPSTGISGSCVVNVTEWDYSLNGGNAILTRYGGAGGSVVIPAAIDGYPVTALGLDVMANKTAITGVELPDTLTTIEVGAFYGCTDLADIDFGSGVLTVGEASFANCSGLTAINFPNQLLAIHDNAFSNCTALNTVTFGDQLISIGENAFAGTELITVTLPDSITAVSNGLFAECDSLTSVTLSDDTTSLGDSAFEGCDSLVSISFPGTLTVIGERAFSGSGLAAITLPNSVRTIMEGAFGNCSALTAVNLGLGVETIGDYAFVYGPFTTLTIPSSVTTIGAGVFLNSGLTEITIPNSVVLLGSQVFQDSTDLSSVSLGNGLTVIPSFAFGGCSDLTTISIPNTITSIEEAAFSGCSGLLTVSFGDQLTSIGENAFYLCSGLTTINLGVNVQTVAASAFQDCTGLTSVTFESEVNEIGNIAFLGCSQLATAYFEGNAPTTVGNDIFGSVHEAFKIYRHGPSTGFDAVAWSWYTIDIY